MPVFSLYDITTGEGLGVVTCPADHRDDQVAGWKNADIIDGACDPMTKYVNNGVVTPRPHITLWPDTDTVPADGSTPVTFVNLIDPVDVQITGPVADNFECTGGTLKLTFAVPGDYTVRFSRFPYIDAQVVIRAT